MGDGGRIRVQEAVLAIANRDRVTERADDGLEAPLAATQSSVQLLDQALTLAIGFHALADVADKGVERPVTCVLER